MKRKKNNQPQSTGKTQISIALPKTLVDRIDAQAALENRNRSNFIATSMEQLMDQIGVAVPAPDKVVAGKPRKIAVAKTATKKVAAAARTKALRSAPAEKKTTAKRSWHRRSPDEIKAILAELRSSTVAQVCEKHGVGQSTLWRWKSLNQ